MIILIYRSIYSWIESYLIIFEEAANIVSLGMRIDIEPNRDEPSDLHPYLALIYIGKIFKKQQSFLNRYNHVISMKRYDCQNEF